MHSITSSTKTEHVYTPTHQSSKGKHEASSSAEPASPLVGKSKGKAQSIYPEQNYRVALIKPESLPSKKTDFHDRIKILSSAVDEANTLFKKQEKKTKTQKNNLFVAPEYFFDKETRSQGQNRHGKMTDRQLTQSDKRAIVDSMQKLSAKYPGMTIMPGTISWKKDINRTEDLQSYLQRHGVTSKSQPEHKKYTAKYFNKQSKESQQPNHDSQNPNTRLNKALNRIQQANENFNAKLEVKEDNITHVVHNTAYVFQEGQTVTKHHKVGNFFDIRQQGDDNRLFSPGDKPGQFQLPDGSKATIEICYDNELQIVGNKNSKNMIQPGNIHILQADTITEVINSEVAKNTDVFVHADTQRFYESRILGPQARHGVKTIDYNRQEKAEVTPVRETENVSLYEPGAIPSKSLLEKLKNMVTK